MKRIMTFGILWGVIAFGTMSLWTQPARAADAVEIRAQIAKIDDDIAESRARYVDKVEEMRAANAPPADLKKVEAEHRAIISDLKEKRAKLAGELIGMSKVEFKPNLVKERL